MPASVQVTSRIGTPRSRSGGNLLLPLLMRFGQRELRICRDFRKRFRAVHPLMEWDTGVQRGHVEILLFRRWLLVLSKAQ